jgi:protein-disulfide isomerase
VGLGVALAGGSSGKSSSSPLKNVSTVRTLLSGIPQHGNVLGSASAPVTLIEYVDMQCPYCDAFEKQVFPGLVRSYVRPGKVRMVIRPLAFIGPDSLRGRTAVIAAGRQDKFFNLMELLYFNQRTENTGWLSQSIVNRAATAVGLDVAKLAADQKSAGVSRAASGFDSLAKSQGVHSTPTVLVGKTGGTLRGVQLNSPVDATSVVDAIQLTSG